MSKLYYHINEEFFSKYYIQTDDSLLINDLMYLYTNYFSNADPSKITYDYLHSETSITLNYLHYPHNLDFYINILFRIHSENISRDDIPILLKGGLTKSGEVPVSQLNAQYRKALHFSIPDSFYPIATRYISSSGYYVIERPPTQIAIDYKIGGAYSQTNKRLEGLQIWIPWTIFIFNPFNPNQYRFYFSSKSLSSMEDNYITPYLPNTYASGDICFSNSLNKLPQDSLPDPHNISLMYSIIYNDYFSGGWNSDLNNPWSVLFNQLQSRYFINQENIDQFKENYPTLAALFFPSKESLGSLLRHSYYRNIYNFSNQTDYPYYKSIYHDLDSKRFHHVILTVLSSFDLPQILQLVDEAIVISHEIYSKQKSTSSSLRSLGYYCENFAKISSTIDQSTQDYHSYTDLFQISLEKSMQIVSSQPNVNQYISEFYEYNFLLTNIDYSEFGYVNHNFAKGTYANAYVNRYLSSDLQRSLFETVINNINSNIHTKDTVYILDCANKLVTFINPDVPIDDFYKSYIYNFFDQLPSQEVKSFIEVNNV